MILNLVREKINLQELPFGRIITERLRFRTPVEVEFTFSSRKEWKWFDL